MLLVITSTGLGHLTIHQTADNITAVGLTTGTKYQDSGPLTVTVTGYPATGTDFEFTVHNINHFVGPGQTDNIYLRTLFHATLDPTTGVAKVDISKDEVLCHLLDAQAARVFGRLFSLADAIRRFHSKPPLGRSMRAIGSGC